MRAGRDAVATITETITYAELDRRSGALARALLASGAGKGTRLALLARFRDAVHRVADFSRIEG